MCVQLAENYMDSQIELYKCLKLITEVKTPGGEQQMCSVLMWFVCFEFWIENSIYLLHQNVNF